ncbi:DUF2550 domain-containing protein [Corynebacterium sp.]|uniref:DUF2550 domain-containing protein n=1 Tax=Corynebacterium sp. TaxID=1720 RepID=UPI0026DD1A47|nr:DUF2550 domain-containing protein [Corynebacterium sp.]MDO5033169.1 DUF2550 domain-containing protein [Corynebacterium sp.]
MDFTVTNALVFVACFALIVVLALAANRFFTLRERGTAVLLRRLPAKDTYSWRHGTMRYNGEFVEYFKLRSLSPRADRRINRLDIDLEGTRPMDNDEASFMPEGSHIVAFEVNGEKFELASDLHGIMAFGAWVEAAPSKRQERVDFREMRKRATRFPKN